MRLTDNGQYECQINTEPKIKLNATLIVRENQLMDTPFYGTIIDGPKQNYVKNGMKINLFCTSTFSIMEKLKIDRQIIWSMDNSPITFQVIFLFFLFCYFLSLPRWRQHY